MNKDDSKSFIFTLKNSHGVKPTRFMKKKESKVATRCSPNYGPVFGGFYSDICIDDYCNEEDSCFINDPTNLQYECHDIYKSSLFVNTNDPDETNHFTVLDYEVYRIDYENRDNINKLCKYPDIIWEYIQTKEITNESLKRIDNDIEFMNDLDTIYCDDCTTRLKLTKGILRNPSEYLVNTQIVDKQYDQYLREWLGKHYKWKLLYRASEHNYSAYSFHKCCNDKGPTLIVIKSSGGWIFGGYTTQSWRCRSIYYDLI